MLAFKVLALFPPGKTNDGEVKKALAAAFAHLFLGHCVKWPNAVFAWIDRLGDISIQALAATSGLDLLKLYADVLDEHDNVQAKTMFKCMNAGWVCAYSGLTWHAKALGLISVQKLNPEEALGEKSNPEEALAAKPVRRCRLKMPCPKRIKLIRLGPQPCSYQRFQREDVGAEIMDHLLEVMNEADLYIPNDIGEVMEVVDAFMKACINVRSFKPKLNPSLGFTGGISDKHMYSVKSCTRAVLLELAALVAVASRQDHATASHQASSVLSDATAARRTTSTLLMRPEEIAGGLEVASLFFDLPLSTIQKWCPSKNHT